MTLFPSPLATPLALPLVRAVAAVRAWQVAAQQHARRNAMLALTDCTQRRAEREDVEAFLSTRRSARASADDAAATAAVSLQA